MIPKAMILAAGRGTRLRPLTDTLPKPLIPIADKPLIVHHLYALKEAGVTDVVINVAYQAQRIQTDLGDGQAFGIKIHYSIEPEESPLEMGGGIVQALPTLGNAPFLVISSDVWTDYPLTRLFKPLHGLAHVVLVDNPWHHPQGDFCLDSQGLVQLPHHHGITQNFAGIGLYRPELFADYPPGVQKMAPIFHAAIAKKQISGEYYSGRWINVTTSRCLHDAQILYQKSYL